MNAPVGKVPWQNRLISKTKEEREPGKKVQPRRLREKKQRRGTTNDGNTS